MVQVTDAQDRESVFCQITGREISAESCARTQGQEGCFGCASPVRICEVCHRHFAIVSATGTCSACTQAQIDAERPLDLKKLPAQIECKFMRKQVSGVACWSSQGQEECRGCVSPARLCETCGKHPVRYPSYGLCFSCTVSELGEGWHRGVPDIVRRDAVHQNKPSTIPDEVHGEIRLLSQDFRRVLLARIKDPTTPLRSVHTDSGALEELGDSMASDGLISPIILEDIGEDQYEILIGSRRVRAARARGALEIPALVLERQNALSRLVVMLAENLHRVPLDPLEEGKAFVRLMGEFKLDTMEIARKVNRHASYVRQRIQLVALPVEAQELVARKHLSIRNAASLAILPDEQSQVQLATEAVAHRLAVPELQRRVTKEKGPQHPARKSPVRFEITPQKMVARINEFALWFERNSESLVLGTITESEIVEIEEMLDKLESQTKAIRRLVTSRRD